MVTHNRQSHPESSLLAELAGLYGVLTGYRDSKGRWRESPPESVVAVLRSLGAELPASDCSGMPSGVAVARAIRARRAEEARRLVEPVLVAWDGVLTSMTVNLPRRGLKVLALSLSREDGAVQEWNTDASAVSVVGAEGPGPRGYQTQRIKLPWSPSRRLPLGYHRLRVSVVGRHAAEVTVISAPRRCWSGAGERQPALPTPVEHGRESNVEASGRGCGAQAAQGQWGLFAPLYALRSDRNWGAGDLADLRDLRNWVRDRGGSMVALLPLLAGFFDRPFEPSPYRPVSRLFWNEFYLAVEEIAEWEFCPGARKLWESSSVREQLHRLRAEPFVDYRQIMAVKRRILEALARCFHDRAVEERKHAFAAFLRDHPEAEDYARYRADVEGSHGQSVRDEATRYHLYCQWQMEEQLARISQDRGSSQPGLFVDLPLGVHPDGFDVRKWPELFVREASSGAPPDDFFSLGQHWDSPPLHPERIRDQGHKYFADCLRHHMRHATCLRIDHVMSLHRLFWVPEGLTPSDGVYVKYPAEELYAVLCVESHKHATVVVGEDLGTVPAGVRSAMKRRGVLRTWVLQSSLRPRAADAVPPVPRHALASLSTHDMFPFAGFVSGDDISARVSTGQLDDKGAHRERVLRRRMIARLEDQCVASRDTDAVLFWARLNPKLLDSNQGRLLFCLLGRLYCSSADLVLVNLDDLVLETRPHNIPGTGSAHENWRRKILRAVGEL